MDAEESVFTEDKWLETVRNLIQKAEHPTCPPDEADACRKRADAIMLKHAIDQAALDATRPAAERMKPSRTTIQLGHHDDPLIYEIVLLGNFTAQHCRCRSVWVQSYFSADTLRVYGYESDLRYFELLYTTLFLHMSRVFFPQIDTNKSLEDNAYDFHNAGLNWIDIAKLYGWVQLPRAVCENAYDGRVMFCHKDTGNIEPITMVGSRIKRAYYRAIRARGEEPVVIPSYISRQSGTLTFRKSAAQGYVNEINDRLRRARGERGPGTDLVLKDRSEEIDRLIAEMEGDLTLAFDNNAKPEFNPAAYAKGRIHAQSADINPAGSSVGGRTAGEIE
jgi:uncharacterized protein DUF2786